MVKHARRCGLWLGGSAVGAIGTVARAFAAPDGRIADEFAGAPASSPPELTAFPVALVVLAIALGIGLVVGMRRMSRARRAPQPPQDQTRGPRAK